MKKRIRCFSLIVGLLLNLFLGTGSVLAASYEGLDSTMIISPPKQKIVLTPGEDFHGSISVSCPISAKYDLVYSTTIGSFNLGKDENGEIDYNDTDVDTITSYNQIMDWIELEEEGGTVKRGESGVVSFVIHVPQNAPAGGQYATIIIQDDTTENGDNGESGNNVTIVSKVRFASEIFAEVTGETKKEGAIIENNIPSFLLNNKLEAGSTVKNNGNVHTDASYVLQVWPLFSDEEICTNEEEPSTSLVMPETERYHSEGCSLPSFGIFKAKQTVKIFGETSVVEKTVIVCPIWLLFLIIFLIVIAIGWVVFRIKSRRKERDDD